MIYFLDYQVCTLFRYIFLAPIDPIPHLDIGYMNTTYINFIVFYKKINSKNSPNH